LIQITGFKGGGWIEDCFLNSQENNPIL